MPINIPIQSTLYNNSAFSFRNNYFQLIKFSKPARKPHHSNPTKYGSEILKTCYGYSKQINKGLLSSEASQPRDPLSTISSKINGIKREGSFAVWIKNYVSLGPKLVEIMKHKLIHGAKIIQYGSQSKLFRKSFGTREGEKLLQATQCCLYTTAGAIAGLLFVSTERVSFCSDRSINTYSRTGEKLKFQYKVSIPLGKIKGVGERMNMKKPWNNYVELVTVDDFSFWFMGLINHKKMLRYLHHATSRDCLCN